MNICVQKTQTPALIAAAVLTACTSAFLCPADNTRDVLVLMLPLDCSAIYAPAINSEIH